MSFWLGRIVETKTKIDLEALYKSKTKRSWQLFQESLKYLPGGDSHPNSRFFAPYPFFAERGSGGRLYDVDGNEYVDYWLGHGALFMGHCNPVVVKAVKKQLDTGIQLGTYLESQVELAKQALKMIKVFDKIRFCNTGTEATLSACRLARAYTSKRRIAKFQRHYHGWHDAVLKGSSPPYEKAGSIGLAEDVVGSTIVLPWNDLDGCRKVIDENKDELAAIILEPSPAVGVSPAEGFLQGLREITEQRNIVLIFDEVVTGFRFAPGGAQEYFGVTADIATYAKVLGGGLPIGAVAGKEEIMGLLNDPTKPEQKDRSVFQGGTYSGNPVSMAAGLAALRELENGNLYQKANGYGQRLRKGMQEIIDKTGIEACVVGDCSASTMLFMKNPPKTMAEVGAGTQAHKRLVLFRFALVTKGVFSRFSSRFYNSTAHNDRDLDRTLSAIRETVKSLDSYELKSEPAVPRAH
jgi:glutamate-1-semialdehyde 2,1-aminomutase